MQSNGCPYHLRDAYTKAPPRRSGTWGEGRQEMSSSGDAWLEQRTEPIEIGSVRVDQLGGLLFQGFQIPP